MRIACPGSEPATIRFARSMQSRHSDQDIHDGA